MYNSSSIDFNSHGRLFCSLTVFFTETEVFQIIYHIIVY